MLKEYAVLTEKQSDINAKIAARKQRADQVDGLLASLKADALTAILDGSGKDSTAIHASRTTLEAEKTWLMEEIAALESGTAQILEPYASATVEAALQAIYTLIETRKPLLEKARACRTAYDKSITAIQAHEDLSREPIREGTLAKALLPKENRHIGFPYLSTKEMP